MNTCILERIQLTSLAAQIIEYMITNRGYHYKTQEIPLTISCIVVNDFAVFSPTASEQHQHKMSVVRSLIEQLNANAGLTSEYSLY